jgi:hypothetical protein
MSFIKYCAKGVGKLLQHIHNGDGKRSARLDTTHQLLNVRIFGNEFLLKKNCKPKYLIYIQQK